MITLIKFSTSLEHPFFSNIIRFLLLFVQLFSLSNLTDTLSLLEITRVVCIALYLSFVYLQFMKQNVTVVYLSLPSHHFIQQLTRRHSKYLFLIPRFKPAMSLGVRIYDAHFVFFFNVTLKVTNSCLYMNLILQRDLTP